MENVEDEQNNVINIAQDNKTVDEQSITTETPEASKNPLDEEKAKQEMIEQLKKLGNMCLKPFGMSTDDFQMVPQEGGGFSVQMRRNQ